MFTDATANEIDIALENAWKSFLVYRQFPLKHRADFMRAIAYELEQSGDQLIKVSMEETNLPEARLKGERARTIFQLNSYAAACERGEWLEARIDTAIPTKTPPKPDIRKLLVPLGPVVVFGASNFPFAYSTAGGDTACAFAAGCPVIVKAHPAHAQTSEIVAACIAKAAVACNLPAGIFSHIHGSGFEVGRALITHNRTAAVGFTGSLAGGKALFDLATQRKNPIPVFSEMGSVNPVFLLPGKMKIAAAETATMFAGSITLGVGQFCTNPGLIIGIDNADLDNFIQTLAIEIRKLVPGTMLHPGIAKAFVEKRSLALHQQTVHTEAISDIAAKENQGLPTIASASAEAFIKNPVLHQEVFGPYSLVIKCKNIDEMLDVVSHLEGQLTTSIMATEDDMIQNKLLVESLKNICGRFIVNGPPTGVEVCLSMHHGGPYPATTDSRFTSVGADGIKRFARPISFQNWPDAQLPEELQNKNPLNIWRTIDDTLTKESVIQHS